MWFYKISDYVILWNLWLCCFLKVLTICSKNDSEYVCTWTYSIFILPEEYWWIGCSGPAPKFWFLREHFVLVPSGTFCSGSFGDILFWFLRGHSDSGMEMTSDVHRGDFLGLKTSIRRLMFCYILSGSICNSSVLSGNTIYTRIPIIRLSDLFLCVHCICIRYLLNIVLTFILTL